MNLNFDFSILLIGSPVTLPSAMGASIKDVPVQVGYHNEDIWRHWGGVTVNEDIPKAASFSFHPDPIQEKVSLRRRDSI